MIADPKEIDRCYVEAVNKKYSDYPDFYPESDYQCDDSGFYPENDYPHYYPESDYEPESDDSGFFDDCGANVSLLLTSYVPSVVALNLGQ